MKSVHTSQPEINSEAVPMNRSVFNVGLHAEVMPGSGPYLLLVHGFLSSRSQWIPNIPVLSRTVRPVVIELLGHGRSPAPEDPACYHPDAYVDAFERIRESLGTRQWFICGQSLGAALTLRYALCRPEAVQGQIFTNTVAALAQTENIQDIRKFSEISAKEILMRGPGQLDRLPMHPKNARHLREDVREALLEDCIKADVTGIANTLRYTLPEVSVRDKIHANQVPALLICGKREKRFTVFREFARDHMPNLEIVDLDAGHAVNVGAAEGFNSAVTRFIIRRMEEGKGGKAGQGDAFPDSPT
jgi:2-succinyl-6-hydroxy-2,4-cyclohexadiene-1-carboxylate synthase